ncbi:MAG: AraC family transcriptional regulator [bacterium]|nr:AraC family transcriptional regulator [bacterium]
MYSNDLVCEILKFINNNINKEITTDELCNIFQFDKTYIMKKFKKELGISIHNYINQMRVYQSLSNFKTDDYMLGIGIKHGFNSLEYFSETFKKVIGVSPTTYKNFLFKRSSISIENENTIMNSIIRLHNLKNSVNYYLNNQKPKELPVKTIFKL